MAMSTGMAPARPSGARRWRSSDAWAAGQFWRPPTYGGYQGSGRAAPGPAGRFRTPVSPADDLERTLATLASALAADLTQRRAAESGRPTQPFADTPGDIEAPRRAAEAGRPAQQLAGAAGDADAQRRAV